MVTLTKFRTMNKGDELVDIVNHADKVIGTATRRDVDEHPELYRVRVSRVIVRNKVGEILVQQRSPDKSTFPGLYDVGVAETLAKNELYDYGARRGVIEELFHGREDLSSDQIAVQRAFPDVISVRGVPKNYGLFVWEYDPKAHGVIVPEPGEVARVDFVKVGPELESLIRKEEFSPIGRFMAELTLFVHKYGEVDLFKLMRDAKY